MLPILDSTSVTSNIVKNNPTVESQDIGVDTTASPPK